MWVCSNSDNNNLIAITKYLILTHCLANWNGTLLTMCLGISLIKRTEPWKRQVLQTQQFFYMCRLIPTLSIGQWYWAQQGWNQDVKEFHFCQCRWKLNFQHFFSTKTTVAFDWTQIWILLQKYVSRNEKRRCFWRNAGGWLHYNMPFPYFPTWMKFVNYDKMYKIPLIC